LRQVFADTAYRLALTNPFDQHHDRATRASASLEGKRIVTSDAVLTEYLNALADELDRAVKEARHALKDALGETRRTLDHFAAKTKSEQRRVA